MSIDRFLHRAIWLSIVSRTFFRKNALAYDIVACNAKRDGNRKSIKREKKKFHRTGFEGELIRRIFLCTTYFLKIQLRRLLTSTFDTTP